jgi:hypothetical protein
VVSRCLWRLWPRCCCCSAGGAYAPSSPSTVEPIATGTTHDSVAALPGGY